MRKKIINPTLYITLLLILILFNSCKKSHTNINKSAIATNINAPSVTNEGIQILVIDSCEYIWCKNGYGAGLTHKGNCKFCAERNK